VPLAYNIVPFLLLIPYRLDPRPASARFWQPAISFLEYHNRPEFRVEVVPTASHWESYWIPHAGFALARGWYRQLDVVDNPVLYRSKLGAVTYRHWLLQMGIRYVLVPKTKLDPIGGPAEARVAASSATGLRRVFESQTWTIYELPSATPLLTGRSPAHLLGLGHETVTGTAARRGRYLLRVRFNPYWQVEPSGACVRRAANGMTQLILPRAGRFTLVIPSDLGAVLEALTRSPPALCKSSDSAPL